jgi:methyl-accepting chemotaxis protein
MTDTYEAATEIRDAINELTIALREVGGSINRVTEAIHSSNRTTDVALREIAARLEVIMNTINRLTRPQ